MSTLSSKIGPSLLLRDLVAPDVALRKSAEASGVRDRLCIIGEGVTEAGIRGERGGGGNAAEELDCPVAAGGMAVEATGSDIGGYGMGG